MLGKVNVSAGARLELIAAAKTRVDLLYLQGSASYLMIELGLEGKVMGKPDMLSRINREIRIACTVLLFGDRLFFLLEQFWRVVLGVKLVVVRGEAGRC
jgi:hypothetical protein